ncbi:hypothetical protein IWQ61_009113 [Dispira simplex]|nr:hypothetical protein IWQ61_009113 [Dispira simplex]
MSMCYLTLLYDYEINQRVCNPGSIPTVNADAFECSATNGRIGISPSPLCSGDPLLTVHYSPDFSVTATFQLVPAGEYRVVWQFYLTPESAGLRNICFGVVVYWRNRLVTRKQRYYHPPENTWQRLPRDQLVQFTVPDRLIVGPGDEYTKVVVKCYSGGSNWKINLALHSVALRATQ